MDIGVVDASATLGRSALHKATPGAKLLAFALLLSAVISTTNVLVLGGITLALVGAVLGNRLPARPMLALAAYPGFFAVVFAWAANAGLLGGSLIVVKAVTAALSAVILMFTTPYPQVFAPVQRWLPPVIGDALLITYRSLFLMLETFSHTLRAAKLRAGFVGRQPLRSAGLVSRSLGSVLLYSIDLSQRTYDIMHLRGYEKRLVVSPQQSVSRALDVSVVLCAAAVAGIALLWRLEWRALNPYSWLPTTAGLLILGVGLLLSFRRDNS